MQYAQHLREYFEQTRYFDLQPYYRVEGGEALGLQVIPYEEEKPEGIEYTVYVEKPGPVELLIPKHKYDVSWFNPLDGAWLDQKDKFNGERFQRQPARRQRTTGCSTCGARARRRVSTSRFTWSRARRRSKTIETAKADLPFQIQLPDREELVAGQEFEFNATLTKDTHAAKRIYWLWTVEVAGSGVGARILGTSQFGRFRVPERLADHYPATLQVRLVGVDGAGRVFEAFKPYRLAAPPSAGK